jgi:hypothetical protein
VRMTNSAKRALAQLTEEWSQYHQQEININTAVRDFQAVLARARDDHSKWPTVVMDWTMPEQKDALYSFIPAAMTTSSPDYPIEAEYIALNGVVSQSSIFPAWNPRMSWLTLCVAYTLSCTTDGSRQSGAVCSQNGAYLDLPPQTWSPVHHILKLHYE